MIATLRSFLTSRAAEWGISPQGEWKCLFYNNYEPRCSSVIIFWFSSGDRFPKAVTKLCEDEGALRREFENMECVYGGKAEFGPRPLHFGPAPHGMWSLWMEGLPGTPPGLEECRRASVLRSVSDILRRLHIARAAGSELGPERYRRMVVEPLLAATEYGRSPAVVSGCESVRAQASQRWMDSLPSVPQHGDFTYGNLLFSKETYHVLDWDTYGVVDIPLCDLVTFFISVLLPSGVSPASWPREVTAEIPSIIRSHSDALGLEPNDARLLLPLSLLNWFHLKLQDGCERFAASKYGILESYFREPDQWQAAIVGAAAAAS